MVSPARPVPRHWQHVQGPDAVGPLHTGEVGVSPRPSRRTNLALLVLLAGAFVTGWVGFGIEGSPESRVVSVIHGILGLGIPYPREDGSSPTSSSIDTASVAEWTQ